MASRAEAQRTQRRQEHVRRRAILLVKITNTFYARAVSETAM
jgi:hypothetical protein